MGAILGSFSRWSGKLGAVRTIGALALIAAAGLLHAQPRPPATAPTEAAPQPLSENARDVLARVRPAIVQIKGFFGANTAQAFHGTGFAVAPNGVLLTNFHVVAEQVQFPEKYRLEYYTPEGRTGKITVLAIDVLHDLAVVKADGFTPPPMTLEAVVPAKGERAYSIGFPLDVGLTITEGVSNGRVEDSFDARIHYSGAINGGMSGGPALNASGKVIGINVSGYRFEQLVSFLVPAEHAQALIDKALKSPFNGRDAKKEVATQLRGHAAKLLQSLDGAMVIESTAGYELPAKLKPFIACNAAGDPSSDQPVQTERISCSAKAGLYVQQGMYSGDLKYSHYVMTTDKLDAWRFSQRLGSLSQAAGSFGSRKHVGPFACKNSAVKLQGFDASLLVCARSYRKFEGLYDITVRVVSLNQPKKGFASHLDMYGVDYDAGMGFVKRYVEAMRWKP